MSDFLVLGLIPGTPIQITFLLWIVGVIIVVALAISWLGHRNRTFSAWLIASFLTMQVRKMEVAEIPTVIQ